MNTAAGFTDALTEAVNEEQYNREGCKGYEEQLPVQIQHHSDRYDKDNALGKHFHNVFYHSGLQRINVVGNITHNGTGFMLVIKAHAQALQLFKNIPADINNHTLTDIVHQIALSVIGNTADNKNNHDADNDIVQHGCILITQNLVYHVLDNPGQISSTAGGDAGADKCCQRTHPVGLYIFQCSKV